MMIILKLLPGVALFAFCVYSFCREVRRDRQRVLERDRLGDEHMLREIEKFLKEQETQKQMESKRAVETVQHSNE